MPMMIWKRIKNRIKVLCWAPRSWVSKQVVRDDETLRSFGTTYAPGTVVDRDSLRKAHAVLCGAGEDISFDLSLQRHFGCSVQIVDPTPRAIMHVSDVLKAGKAGEQSKLYLINNIPVEYDLTGIDFSAIELVPFGVWDAHTTLRFYAPQDPNHVSYSITNLQETESYIEIKTKTLDEITSRRIGLLKLNIEGAEIEVLIWLAKNSIRPEQILVVFDELHTPSAQSPTRIRAAVNSLTQSGYRLVYFDGFSSCLFLHQP